MNPYTNTYTHIHTLQLLKLSKITLESLEDNLEN